ncbi:VOC family protein [Mycobacterium sp. OTB74]|jgi:catechol 2,3-dioxygenase-like lactoylglutathione lyase family enzyme|uniref:VOC family protein n=1 Tax=Mycobacterium sp. OTB74 TaxID=1853452 RepID=UPI002474032F|nr:VOC family protein [Mycobacterium sp. OTB74]MDH6244488.1 catechol 2,3-dioxygenase-like lactoylglutathione lyase family enzyme [Mycobacterium sp. OTB74]
MAITFNHTIVYSADRDAAAAFFTELFGLPPAKDFGRFRAVELNHGVSLDFGQAADVEQISPQHYAFLVSEDEFTAIYGRIRERGLPHWADPQRQRPDEINHHDGGRGVYFADPSGHYLEIITRPYGSGG